MSPTELNDPSDLKTEACAAIDALSPILIDVSHDIHAHPELNYEEHFAHDLLTEAIERAIAASLVEGGPRTKDLGGNGDTKTVGAAIAELVKTV